MDVDPGNVLGFVAEVAEICDKVGDEDTPVKYALCYKVIMIVLKLLSEGCEIGSETWIIVNNIVPNLNTMHGVMNLTVHNEYSINSTSNATVIKIDSKSYKVAAYAYILFYVLGLLAVLVYWIITCVNKRSPSGLAVLMAFVCEMPLMVAEMCMLKAGGVINWNDQLADLILQICFLINVFIQIYFDVLRIWEDHSFKWYCILGHIFILGIDFVITCILYAPVMWAMAGWHWFTRIRMSDIKGILTSEHAENALDILMLIGHIGQWVLSFIIVCILLWLICKCFCGDSQVDSE